jgi:8-oxo-dGTP pyrophosphatase MutT (NUDIX family)
MPTTSAGVFLHNGRKVLLVHQIVSKMWSFPKGCKEEGECNDECWKRELEEETGITYIPFHKVTGSTDVLKYNITIVELFTDNLPTPKLTLPNSEVDKVMWVDLDKVLKMDLNAVTKQVIKSHAPVDPFRSFQSCQKMVRRGTQKSRPNALTYQEIGVRDFLIPNRVVPHPMKVDG